MPDPEEVIPGAGEPRIPAEPIAPRARAPRGVQCDFCGCVVDPDGHVLKRGEEAAAYLDLGDLLKVEKAANGKLRERITELETEVADCRAKLSEFTKKKAWPF